MPARLSGTIGGLLAFPLPCGRSVLASPFCTGPACFRCAPMERAPYLCPLFLLSPRYHPRTRDWKEDFIKGLTQNFTRKKALEGPRSKSSFSPPFFSGNLS